MGPPHVSEVHENWFGHLVKKKKLGWLGRVIEGSGGWRWRGEWHGPPPVSEKMHTKKIKKYIFLFLNVRIFLFFGC